MNTTLHSYLYVAYISILLSSASIVVDSFSTTIVSDGKYFAKGRFSQSYGRNSQNDIRLSFPKPSLHYETNTGRQRATPAVSLSSSQGEEDNGEILFDTTSREYNDLFVPSRRSILGKCAPLFIAILNGNVAKSYAEGSEGGNKEIVSSGPKGEFVKGTVTLKTGVENEAGSGAALYVTARPDRPDNVPRAILDGTGGKAPPVLAARFPNPSFPFDLSLTASDLTAEGASGVESKEDLENVKFWWEGEDLVVSARLDSDGVANTRDPTDLVGRGFLKRRGGGDDGFKVELQGRGVGGKFFTGAKK